MDRQIENMASFAFITCIFLALVLLTVCMVTREHSLKLVELEQSVKTLQEQVQLK